MKIIKTIELEYPYIASVSESGRLFISTKRPKDYPPKNVVSLNPESVKDLLELLKSIDKKEELAIM